jgi:hypothetical protein
MMIHTLTLAGLFFIATGPAADEHAGASNAAGTIGEVAAIEAEAPFEPGFKVAVDPVTGEIISQPTEADLEILAEGVRSVRRRSAWELRSFPLQHGGEGVFLDGWADQALEVRVDGEGNLQMTCGQDHDHDVETTEPPSEDPVEENLR